MSKRKRNSKRGDNSSGASGSKSKSSPGNNRGHSQQPVETPRSTDATSETDSSNRRSTGQSGSNSSAFSRYFSFVLLVGIIVLVSILFYEVMAQFLVPLFLSAILVVVFRPVYQWMLEKCRQRRKLAAMLTTIAVMLSVLVPLGFVLMLAAAESRQVLRQFNATRLADGLQQARASLGLEMPPELLRVDVYLDQLLATSESTEDHQIALFEVEGAAQAVAQRLDRQWPELPLPDGSNDSSLDGNSESGVETDADPWTRFSTNLLRMKALYGEIDWDRQVSDQSDADRFSVRHEYRQMLTDADDAYTRFKTEYLGGKSRAWLVELANPSRERIDQYVSELTGFSRDYLLRLGGRGLSIGGRMLLGTAIMLIGFYFFLVDGPAMLETFKGLSPIDDEHEEELVIEFERVSRAVVIATLLSAAVQGLLAGIGFYFAGLDSVFLLMVLSGVLAMVPFVGAASVWGPCALYLYFVDNNLVAAVGLAIYGTAVISMADNLIKPLVLHGQSNLHPLLAFLSVIGGVGALGPIGILIGPMVVAFLQTLLRILRREVTDLGQL